MKRDLITPAGREETTYYIHEVYYDKKGGKPDSITKDPIVILGDDIESLQWTVDQIQKALQQPVLNYEDFPPGNDTDDE